MTLSHENNKISELPGQNHMKKYYRSIIFVPSFICWKNFDLKISGGHYIYDPGNDFRPWRQLWINKVILQMDIQTKSNAKDVLHIFLALFVKNDIFAYLTLK